MSRQEAIAQYTAAWKLGQRYYKAALAKGSYPYPQVLEEILNERMSAGRIELGLVDIPAEQIVGTKTHGRRFAFAGNFMPLFDPETEFATKWISLCEAHLGDEGIRDPIRCCEYMGRFYVQEGNKRVSVLKSYDAPTIPGYVTRILPVYSDDPAVQLYYEFLQFYPRCSLYQIQFTQPGSYEKLIQAMGYEREHVWTTDEKRAFLALQSRFASIYRKLGGTSLPGTVSDALLSCLQVFPFSELRAQSTEQLAKTVEGMWADIKSAALPKQIALSTQPEEKEKGLVSRILGISHQDHLKLAFIYAHKPENSVWTRGHVQGAKALQAAMGAKLALKEYWALDGDYDKAMEEAAADGAELLIATTPQMLGACRRIAAKNPKLRVMDCALSQPYAGLRTYYSRSYEAKFITGAIAGAMAEKDRIGYIANYPIVGVPADINAFALGAQMTNPRVKIELLWSSQDTNPIAKFLEHGIRVISNRDAETELKSGGALDWGLYRLMEDGVVQPLALPCWDWGRFYIQVVQSIFNGSWDTLSKSQEGQAINYWWGMSGHVIDVQFSSGLPEGIHRMAEHLRHDLMDGWVDPFQCRILDQTQTLRNDGSRGFSPEELLQMDWLCENVEGCIPALETLRPEAQETSRILAIHHD